MIGVKGKITIAVILTASIAVSAWKIAEVYKLEKHIREMKAEVEELKESPAEVVQLRPLEPEVIPVKKEEIAPVQIEEPEEETFKAHEEIPLAEEYQEWIERECERLGVNKAYAYALIESESSFRTGLLISDGGGQSAGLCQINSVNWPDMKAKGLDPFDEFDNITYCLTLVSSYIDKYYEAEDLINAVTVCYKAGEGGAKRLGYYLSSCDRIKERMAYYSLILY